MLFALKLMYSYFSVSVSEVGEDALDMFEPLPAVDDDAVTQKLDTCSLTVPEIVITLESGGGKNTMPLFKLESKIQATIQQWSSQVFLCRRKWLSCYVYGQ